MTLNSESQENGGKGSEDLNLEGIPGMEEKPFVPFMKTSFLPSGISTFVASPPAGIRRIIAIVHSMRKFDFKRRYF